MSTETSEPTTRRRRKPSPASTSDAIAPTDLLEPAAQPIAHAAVLIRLEQINPSNSNPRKTFVGIEELAADIRRRTVLQPVLVRPVKRAPFLNYLPDDPERYELVFGERRFRASKLAGVDSIPAMIRDLDDQEVLEIQLIENGKRVDIHPLEEADGFQRLHREFGLTADQIAAKVSKSVDTVKRRIRLCSLVDDARRALMDDEIALRTAEQLAALSFDLQKSAFAKLREEMRYRELTVGFATRVLHGYTLSLADAPFDRGNADLVPSAGACTVCPKRTGAQGDLFAGGESKADRCTDKDCYDEKLDVVWSIRRSKAEASGIEVMPDAQAKKLLTAHDGRPAHGAAYLDLAAEEYLGGKFQTIKKALGKNAPPVTLARDDAGGIHELVARTDVERLLRASGKGGGSSSSQLEANERKRRAEEKVKKTLNDRVLDALVTSAEKATLTDALVLAIVKGMIARAWNDIIKRVCARRAVEIPKGYGNAPKALADAAAKLKGPELRGLLVELAISPYVGAHSDDRIGVAKAAMTILKIDAQKIGDAVRAELKEAKKPATSKKGKIAEWKAEARAAKKTKRNAAGADGRTQILTCVYCGCTDERACIVAGTPCSWISFDPPICSGCEGEAT